jgi:hypothetical protein
MRLLGRVGVCCLSQSVRSSSEGRQGCLITPQPNKSLVMIWEGDIHVIDTAARCSHLCFCRMIPQTRESQVSLRTNILHACHSHTLWEVISRSGFGKLKYTS